MISETSVFDAEFFGISPREAERLDWRPAEAELLQRLYRHAEGAVERLSLGSE